MFFGKCSRTKNAMLIIASVLVLGLSATDAQATKNFNSSKSNTSTVVGVINSDTLHLIVADIDQIGARNITERDVRKILDKRGIKGVNKIVIQRKGNKVEVLMLEQAGDLPAAKIALKEDVYINLKVFEQKKHYRSKPNL